MARRKKVTSGTGQLRGRIRTTRKTPRPSRKPKLKVFKRGY